MTDFEDEPTPPPPAPQPLTVDETRGFARAMIELEGTGDAYWLGAHDCGPTNQALKRLYRLAYRAGESSVCMVIDDPAAVPQPKTPEAEADAKHWHEQYIRHQAHKVKP